MSFSALEFLTEDDHQALLDRATLRECRDGEVVVAQADANRALYVVQEGFVLVQRDVAGVQLSVARMGPGEFFGEMSLLEHAPTSAAVVADGPLTLAVVHVDDLVALGKDREGFNERLFRSLAVALSRRLRELGGFVAAMDRYTADAHQSLVDRLQPPSPGEHNELLERATALRRTLADCEFSSTLGGDEEANMRAVFDEVVSILRIRGAKGAAVLHRELYTTWMTSRTIAGSLLCVGGDPCALPTLERVQRNEPSGEGFVGPVLDAWFLERPALDGLRWASEAVAARLHGRSHRSAQIRKARSPSGTPPPPLCWKPCRTCPRACFSAPPGPSSNHPE